MNELICSTIIKTKPIMNFCEWIERQVQRISMQTLLTNKSAI